MFPLRDENPTLRTPVAVMAIIGLNVAAWALVQGFGEGAMLARSLCDWGLIPGELLHTAQPGTLVPLGENLACRLEPRSNLLSIMTHMFLHGGWFHLIGNLWFLWVFGDNVEDAMGPARFWAFYLLCGLAAAGAQILSNPATAIPMVGASGAIGGVMGAYARLYPRARILTFIFLGFYATTVAVPAIAMLGYWFFIQLASGIPALQEAGGGVAFWAHVGGFVAGVILVGPMHQRELLIDHLRHARPPRRPW
jgi:membrane associated rhomboid family serine protease